MNPESKSEVPNYDVMYQVPVAQVPFVSIQKTAKSAV